MTTLSQNLLDLSDFAWQRLRNRVEGLTDEEYLWEPFDGCWSIRTSDSGLVLERTKIPPEPEPFTTLAWRITHIIDILQEDRTATWFGSQVDPADGPPPVPGSAADALTALDHAYDVWRRRLAALSQDVLDRPMGEPAGMYAEHDGTSFALHILDELIHHGAEVGTVRDFYRDTHTEDPFAAALAGEVRPTEQPALLAEAAVAQRWEVVLRLAGMGFGINERTKDGATAAHLAAGSGALDALRFLVEHGADLTATDPKFHADALGWAKWGEQAEAVAYLESL
ncbi:ankyrin repeat protein [Kribbella rubisoli]|uniref:Ankyrin repeat protein n=1 Tax=Kribbella rubisoli TaxID=3075929 RepID=A0A4Q7WKM8_9ACTN|nr:DinB family protein [Kribbella rubisoli]RZU10604.1 ankyrin repeat protein [Kribbella rubisoli]